LHACRGEKGVWWDGYGYHVYEIGESCIKFYICLFLPFSFPRGLTSYFSIFLPFLFLFFLNYELCFELVLSLPCYTEGVFWCMDGAFLEVGGGNGAGAGVRNRGVGTSGKGWVRMGMGTMDRRYGFLLSLRI
jgi:hypothetical protein